MNPTPYIDFQLIETARSRESSPEAAGHMEDRATANCEEEF